MNKLVLTLIAGTLTLMPNTAQAKGGHWAQNHPCRAHDNCRLTHQNERINQGLRNGTLTHSEASSLRHDDHQIRQEERAMASGNPGHHLTGSEQKALSQQLNQNSRDIRQEKHD